MSVPASEVSSLPPIRKLTSRKWKTLPDKGGSVSINDARLKQGYIGNLQKKSCVELEELIMRQEKLLSNKLFIEKLPDKGKKIRERKDDLQKALDQAKNQVEDIIIPDINALEWQWRDPRNPSLSSQKDVNVIKDSIDTALDSDDDEDPLELLANHGRDVPLRSSTRTGEPAVDPSDAIREELKKLELMDKEESKVLSSRAETVPTKSSCLEKDFGSKLIISLEKKSKPSKEVFKPFRPLKHQHLLSYEKKDNSSDNQKLVTENTKVDKEKCTVPCELLKEDGFLSSESKTKTTSMSHIFGGPAKLGPGVNLSSTARISPLWACESSATGPLNNLSKGPTTVKLVSLRESVQLQKEALERSKKAQLDEAAARLRAPKHVSNKPTRKFSYKDVNSVPHVLQEDDNELNDVFNQYRGICVIESDSSSDSDQE